MAIENARGRMKDIKARIAEIDLVCPGTLIERKKTCGKPNCRCASDPEAMHGPYFEWNRREGGRLVHKTVTSQEAERIRRAIANQREVKALLSQWERESIRSILDSS